jgi:hypothetical protein
MYLSTTNLSQVQTFIPGCKYVHMGIWYDYFYSGTNIYTWVRIFSLWYINLHLGTTSFTRVQNFIRWCVSNDPTSDRSISFITVILLSTDSLLASLAPGWPDEFVNKSPKTWPNPCFVKMYLQLLPRKGVAQKSGRLQGPILNFAPRGKLWPQGRSCPPGVILKNTPEVNNKSPIGETSPNLVTLAGSIFRFARHLLRRSAPRLAWKRGQGQIL